MTLRLPHLLCAAVVLYFPFIFLGYGADGDGFGSVQVARDLLAGAGYHPSRNPGYLVHELSNLPAVLLGAGPWLTNAASLAMGLLTIGSTVRILEVAGSERALLGGALLAIHPIFWTQSTVTMDFVWGLGLATCGVLQLSRGRPWWAALLFGLAAGARSTSAAIGASFLVARCWTHPEERRTLCGALGLFALTTACLYAPSFVQAGYGLAFLSPPVQTSVDTWSLKGHVLRAGYRLLYFWGVPAVLVLAAAALQSLLHRNALAADRDARHLRLGCMLSVALGIASFARYPLEIPYLLCILPFAVMLLCLALPASSRLAPWLAAALASYALVNVQVARGVGRNEDRARYGLWLEPGFVVAHVQERMPYMDARTFADWVEVRDRMDPRHTALEPPAAGQDVPAGHR